MTSTARRLVLLFAVLVLGLAVLAPSADAQGGGQKVDVRFERIPGYNAPGTPAKYNKVGILETGPSDAKNVLVLVPGTSASAAYFEPLAKDIVRRSKGWRGWAGERREHILEDHSVLHQAQHEKGPPNHPSAYHPR